MENYATVPFFILFVWGYLYTGVMSLAQAHIDRIFTFGNAEPALAATSADSFVLATAEGTLAPQPVASSAPKARAASAGLP